MPEVALKSDEITHTNALTGLLAGAAVGLGIGLFAIAGGAAMVLTAGLATPLVVGVVGTAIVAGSTAGMALGGESAGSLVDTVTGTITTGSPNVQVNGQAVARGYGDTVKCDGLPLDPFSDHEIKFLASGSATVTVNSQPVARISDKTECDATIHQGSLNKLNVIIGGPSVQTREIAPEIPQVVNTVLQVVSIGSAIILLPFMPGAIIGGFLGATTLGGAGHWLGGSIFGEGTKGQAWMTLGFGFVGGFAGGLAGNKIFRPPFAPGGMFNRNPNAVDRTGNPSSVFTQRPREWLYRNPPEMYRVGPGEPLPPLDPGRRYLWLVDSEGNFRVAPEEQPGFGRSVKHGDLVPELGGFLRGFARTGGELNFDPATGQWEMNNNSSYVFRRVDLTPGTGDNLQAAYDLLTQYGTDTSNIVPVNTHGADGP